MKDNKIDKLKTNQCHNDQRLLPKHRRKSIIDLVITKQPRALIFNIRILIIKLGIVLLFSGECNFLWGDTQHLLCS